MQNPSFFGDRRAFTLVEMLVVIAIISMVAMASVTSIKSAQRQARSAKCQANMHALYNAAAAYHADKGTWPAAGAYEVYDSRSDTYYQFRGWVNWVLSSGRSRPGDSGNLYRAGKTANKDGGQDASRASRYYYVGTGATGSDAPGSGKINDSRVYRSIDEGSIFRYTDKNFSAYCCDEFKSRYGKQAMRSYAMNQIFGSRRYPRNPLWKETPSDNADRLAMFVELGRGDMKGKTGKITSELGSNVASGKTGSAGGSKNIPSNTFSDDSVWDWDTKSGSGSDGGSGENIGILHKKSGTVYGHVVFADGHLESLTLPKYDKTWKEDKEQRRSLGKGELLAK